MFGIDKTEMTHITIAMLVLSLAFSIGDIKLGWDTFFMFLPVTIVGVGSAFMIHELAHKFVAIRLGAFARFQLWESGLLIALLSAIATGGQYIFAAPGAVYIYAQSLSRQANGLISIAGPLTNLLLGGLFFGVFLFALGTNNNYLVYLGYTAASINFFLGFFNMIPLGPLDGGKVLNWNIGAWILLAVALGAMVFFGDSLFAIAANSLFPTATMTQLFFA